MPSKKQRRRDKRRAERLVDEAAEATLSENWTLAERLMMRALDLGPANARFWKEFGELCLARGERTRADRAFRRALDLSPNYEEARRMLTSLRAEQGDPAAIDDGDAALGEAESTEPVFTGRSLRYDWNDVEAQLVKSGFALLPGLLGPEECGDCSCCYRQQHSNCSTLRSSSCNHSCKFLHGIYSHRCKKDN